MPIRKFRSVEEMSQPNWREPGDPRLYRVMRALWDFATRTSRLRFRPGVYKYRCVADFDPERIRKQPES